MDSIQIAHQKLLQ